LIYVNKIFKGGFQADVLTGSFKNKTVAELSLKKMLAAGIKAKLVMPNLPKPVGRPRNWENVP